MSNRFLIYLAAGLPIALFAIQGQEAKAQPATEEAPVIALEPTPHPAGCADFVPVGNGSWNPIGPVRICNTITMNWGVTFSEGAVFAGINIAQWLNQHCKPL